MCNWLFVNVLSLCTGPMVGGLPRTAPLSRGRCGSVGVTSKQSLRSAEVEGERMTFRTHHTVLGGNEGKYSSIFMRT
jgi:hypothetical protein